MPINILFPYVYSPIPYSGSFSGKMVSLGPSRQDGKKNLSVRTSFNWLNYPGNSVDVNIQSQGSSPPIDQIKMVYIDNTTNSNNISLYFSDTQQFIECPSNSAAYIPVATGGLKCTVYNVQTSNSDNVGFNSNSNTDIFFYNFEVEGVFTTETQPSAATGTYANIISIISSGDNETVLGNAGLNRRNTIIGLNISVANIVVTTAGVLTVALAQGPIPISAQPAFQWQ
jgi:hypothetical protein